MDRWVALVLAVIVIVVAFAAVAKIQAGQNELPDTGNNAECLFAGGMCVPEADCGDDQILTPACGEGTVCCGEAR